MEKRFSAGITTYSVGFFMDYHIYREDRKLKKKGAGSRLKKQVKANFFKRDYWTGYMAIWQFPPHGIEAPKPGTAWTRHRARKRLGQNIVKEHLAPGERGWIFGMKE